MYNKGDLVKYIGEERMFVVEGKWSCGLRFGTLGIVTSGHIDKNGCSRYLIHFQIAQMANKKYEIAGNNLQRVNNV